MGLGKEEADRSDVNAVSSMLEICLFLDHGEVKDGERTNRHVILCSFSRWIMDQKVAGELALANRIGLDSGQSAWKL